MFFDSEHLIDSHIIREQHDIDMSNIQDMGSSITSQMTEDTRLIHDTIRDLQMSQDSNNRYNMYLNNRSKGMSLSGISDPKIGVPFLIIYLIGMMALAIFILTEIL